jgi:hypothetical protein
MKMTLVSILRAAALAPALLLLPALASAADSAPADSAAQMLTVVGSVPVKDAGPYVHVGSYRIHVWTMLGRPNAILPDGTWFYKDFSANDSIAHGTLVVFFDNGRVTKLSLVTPEVATAMLSKPEKNQEISQLSHH